MNLINGGFLIFSFKVYSKTLAKLGFLTFVKFQMFILKLYWSRVVGTSVQARFLSQYGPKWWAMSSAQM